MKPAYMVAMVQSWLNFPCMRASCQSATSFIAARTSRGSVEPESVALGPGSETVSPARADFSAAVISPRAVGAARLIQRAGARRVAVNAMRLDIRSIYLV